MPCPICSKPTATKYRPFCSARCADIDLARWLGGRYVLSDDEEEEKPSEDRPKSKD